MITRDTIDEIQRLKETRYSQSKIAKLLNLSKSTVARNWHGEKGTAAHPVAPKRLRLEDLFLIGTCDDCGITYPMPKFLPSWACPGCYAETDWQKCWYTQKPSK